MKTIFKKWLLLAIAIPVNLLAQNKLDGKVTDQKMGQLLPGVNVVVKGSNNGVSTDFDGNYSITNLKNGDVIEFSYLGFNSQSVTYSGQKSANIQLREEISKLQEVVVIGYGSVKKKDATGSVDLITSKEFNKGPVLSVDQLLVGKAAGVRITNAGGAPDSAPNIRIRGGSSLSAQNNPLIVIDGVPIDTKNAAGNGNPLALINPSDIESFSILKDASATAIYGSRASNGVLIITTKKGGSGKPEFEFNSNVSMSSVQKKINLMNGQQFADFVRLNHPTKTDLLGIDDPNSTFIDDLSTPQIEGRILSNTDWQDVIYRDAVTIDNNFSARANLFGKIPFRASVGHSNAQGVIKTNDFERFTTSLKLTPMLFNNHLKIDVNAKGLISEKKAIDEGVAIRNALNFDPTKPVYGTSPNNIFNGYYQQFNSANNTVGGTNPLNVLEQRQRPEAIRKFLGNVELDYKLHFFPALRAVLNLGLETSDSNIEEVFGPNAIQTYQPNTQIVNPGTNYREKQTVVNKTMDAYLVYSKEFNSIIKKFDVQGGYSYQNFVHDGNSARFRYNQTTGVREEQPATVLNNRYYDLFNLQSFFGRSNINLLDRYLFTASFRADASSLFRNNNVWGYFPSAAFAWKIKEESFLKNSKFVSELKLRLGWGKTGQQDVTNVLNYYPSTPLFTTGSSTSQYLPGFQIYSANAFNPDLTWEKSTTQNIGLDFGLFKNEIISGNVDFFKTETTDLLASVPLPPGQGLTNEFIKNAGSMETKGFEVGLNAKVFSNDNTSIELNANLAYAISEVKDLDGVKQVITGDAIPVGTGQRLTYNAVGFQPQSAWVFQQIYDVAGKPIEGAYVDRNNDNVVNDEDRYFKATRPNWTFGFGTSVNYKNFDLNASFRGQFGGLIYNTRNVVAGNINQAIPTSNDHLSNVLATPLVFQDNNGFVPLSDYFLEDASFLRCESISLGYKNTKIIKNGSIRFYVATNNLFLISDYKGQDPESINVFDSNFYPRPKTYSFGINVNF